LPFLSEWAWVLSQPHSGKSSLAKPEILFGNGASFYPSLFSFSILYLISEGSSFERNSDVALRENNNYIRG